jgi:iron complex transport system ATP-binding protein
MILTASTVSVRLNDRLILDQVSLACASGQMHGLIGPNGAGKSTLLKTLAGLITPVSGTLSLDDSSLATMSRALRAQRIAYLPQHGDVAWSIPARALVALGRLPHHDSEEAGHAAVTRALARCDAEQFAGLRADRLSAGERARVLLARALTVEAPVLLADEPVAALDPLHQLQVMRTLREEAERGAIVLVVLHDLTLAARFCHNLLLMSGGRIAATGAPDTVLGADKLAQIFGISAHAGIHEGERFVLPWRANT